MPSVLSLALIATVVAACAQPTPYVGGQVVVHQGQLTAARPGRAGRAPVN